MLKGKCDRCGGAVGRGKNPGVRIEATNHAELKACQSAKLKIILGVEAELSPRNFQRNSATASSSPGLVLIMLSA